MHSCEPGRSTSIKAFQEHEVHTDLDEEEGPALIYGAYIDQEGTELVESVDEEKDIHEEIHILETGKSREQNLKEFYEKIDSMEILNMDQKEELKSIFD
jgi:hypothetical protein